MFRIARRERITSFSALLKALMVKYIGLMINKGKVCILIIMIMNTAYNTTLKKPIHSSVYRRYIALFSQGFSDCKSTEWQTYLTPMLRATVNKMAYSKPNTNWTEAPLVIVDR